MVQTLNETRETELKPGEMVAALLRGAWRAELSPLLLSEAQTRAAVTIAVKGGGAGLAYRRLRPLPQYAALVQSELREAYKLNGLRAAAFVYHAQRVVNALHAADVEPLLVKGWAIARHYPELALRPMGDMDLFVPPAQFARAQAVLAQIHVEDMPRVDLHSKTQDASHAAQLAGHTLEDLYARSVWAELGAARVRVPSPEDHLNLLCMHWLRHGGWRPLWLCDIAIALETRPQTFDWDIALGQGHEADWIACTLGAAHQLLDARVDDTPVFARAKNLPRWFVPAILAEWVDPDPARHTPPAPIHLVWKLPRELWRALRGRWFNPIESSVMVDAPFNATPRVWYQARYFARQGRKFVTRPR